MKTTSFMMTAFGAGLAGGLLWARHRNAISLAGRVAWITGGSRGLGLEIARELLARDARVVLSARDAAELDRAAQKLDAEPHAVMTLTCDVTRAEDVGRVTQQIVRRFGGIDLLFNCAGVIQVAPLDLLTDTDFAEAMNTHFWGPLHTMTAVSRVMREQQRPGRIVNIASMGGVVAMPHMAAYCASKFALVGLSDAFRAELAPHDIGVLTVCPGMMRTGSHVNATFKGARDKEYAWFSAGNAIPGLSISATRAATAIVQASQNGRNRVDLSLPAHLGRLAQAVAPDVLADVMKLVARALPTTPQEPDAENLFTGGEVHREQVRSKALNLITKLSDRASVRNNELS